MYSRGRDLANLMFFRQRLKSSIWSMRLKHESLHIIESGRKVWKWLQKRIKYQWQDPQIRLGAKICENS